MFPWSPFPPRPEAGQPFGAMDGLPVGTVVPFAGRLLPSGHPPERGYTQVDAWGWLLCDGSELTIGEYPELFAALGDLYGGDGRTTFAIPDYRGYFLRCVDACSGNDPDRDTRTPPANGTGSDPGATQAPAIQEHEHHYVKPLQPSAAQEGEGTAVPADDPEGLTSGLYDTEGAPLKNKSTQETRPKNIYVNYLIKVAYLGRPRWGPVRRES